MSEYEKPKGTVLWPTQGPGPVEVSREIARRHGKHSGEEVTPGELAKMRWEEAKLREQGKLVEVINGKEGNSNVKSN